MKLIIQISILIAFLAYTSCKSNSDKTANSGTGTNIIVSDTSKNKIVNVIMEGLYVCETSDGMPFGKVIKANPELTPPSLTFKTEGTVDMIDLNGKQTTEKFTVKGTKVTIKDEIWVVKDNTITYGNPPRNSVYVKKK